MFKDRPKKISAPAPTKSGSALVFKAMERVTDSTNSLELVTDASIVVDAFAEAAISTSVVYPRPTANLVPSFISALRLTPIPPVFSNVLTEVRVTSFSHEEKLFDPGGSLKTIVTT